MAKTDDSDSALTLGRMRADDLTSPPPLALLAPPKAEGKGLQ